MADVPSAGVGSRKRILALDGGGVRGVFTIEILAKIEELLRIKLNNQNLVLAEYFDFMAGTSVGAIAASMLSWGCTVDVVRTHFHEQIQNIFPKPEPWRVWEITKEIRSIYGAEALSFFLKSFFHDSDTNETARLGTKKLKNLLLVSVRNATTGAAWPITNNPKSKYNLPSEPDCNLNIPLWKVVRASTAAPIYFPPEEIELRKNEQFSFVDGGMTPYNTPALLAFLVATLPSYHLEWSATTQNLQIISVGTGRIRSTMHTSLFSSNIGSNLIHVPSGLMENISLQQDFLCRVLGRCLFGDEIDTEVGTLMEEECGGKKFDYVRYDHRFHDDEIKSINQLYGGLTLSNLRTIPYMCELGKKYAKDNVKIEHLI